MNFANILKKLRIIEDVTPEKPQEPVEIVDVCDKRKDQEHKLLKTIDGVIKQGLPVRENTSLFIVSQNELNVISKHTNTVSKVVCTEAVDKQFILKNLNHKHIYLSEVGINAAIGLFECNDLPIKATQVSDIMEHLVPGDIICYGDKDNSLCVLQFRGRILSNEDILAGNIPMDEKITAKGPSAVKIAYLKSMEDYNTLDMYGVGNPVEPELPDMMSELTDMMSARNVEMLNAYLRNIMGMEITFDHDLLDLPQTFDAEYE